MLSQISGPTSAIHKRVTILLKRLGLGDDAVLVLLAIIIGLISAAAAVAFHETVGYVRDLLYEGAGPSLYHGRGIWLVVLLPAAGGLAVGVMGRWMTRQSHGMVDVIESVQRSRGFIRSRVAMEKILTSGLTIGSGGSAGAEGPIVQIGAAIASGIGTLFRISRQQMPLLVGCGSAAGISAIFNAPIGGVLFTLEVLLGDFSVRSFTPLVLASVVANLGTKAIFRWLNTPYEAIFSFPSAQAAARPMWVDLNQLPNFALLGVICGVMAVGLILLMDRCEEWFSHWKFPAALKPASGGLALGLMGMGYVVLFGWMLMGTSKPFGFEHYSMPAIFGDGYGVIRQMLDPNFYHTFLTAHSTGMLLLLLGFITAAKIVGCCLTLGSGGSGGVIAPSLFAGAGLGGLLGVLLNMIGANRIDASLYSLIGMGATLAAVVHAPLASILILMELTRDSAVVLPAMPAAVLAVAVARLLYPDSIYTMGLRRRGLRFGNSSGGSALHRLSVEEVPLEPVVSIQHGRPLQEALDLADRLGISDFVVLDQHGHYQGMICAQDLQTALLQREAIPLLLVAEVMRFNIPTLDSDEDLATALETFAAHDVRALPVCLPSSERVIGLLSRGALMNRYRQAMHSGV